MIRLLRVLARLLPAELRRRFGPEIEADLARAWRRESRRRGPLGRPLLAARLLLDLLRNCLPRRSRIPAGSPSPMHALTSSLRWALRSSLRRPLFSSLVVITLALALGATIAIFGIVEAEVLRPLPFAEQDRLVVVGPRFDGRLGNMSYPNLQDLRRQSRAFEELTGFDDRKVFTISGIEAPVRVYGAAVDGTFFPLLGTRPILGRALGPEDDRHGADLVVVLGEGLWRRELGGDPGVIGRSIRLNQREHVIVGVMPAEFRIPDREDLWVPHATHAYDDEFDRREVRRLRYLEVVGRMAPGADLEAARRELRAMSARLEEADPEANEELELGAMTLREQMLGGGGGVLPVLAGAVLALLGIAGVNVAGLMAARIAARRRELAVRRALGAARGRITLQLVAEALLLSLTGGGLGVLLATWLLRAIPGLLPGWFPRLEVQAVDGTVLAFGVALSVASGALLGIGAAMTGRVGDRAGALRAGGTGSTAGPRGPRLRRGLVAGQLALAFVLLVAAGLLVRSLHTLGAVPTGFDTEGLLTAQVALPATTYDAADRARFFAALVRGLEASPGVESAAVASRLPLTEGTTTTELEIRGIEMAEDETPAAHYRVVGPGYFRTLGIPIVAGRGFAGSDDADAEPVAIVDEAVAERYWPRADAVGGHLRVPGQQVWRRVVGVVGETRHWGRDQDPTPTLYVPHGQSPEESMMVALRTVGEPTSAVGHLRDRVRRLDPNVPLDRLQTMADYLSESSALRRVGMLVLAFFSSTALLLAALGVYGVVSHLVALRTREIGVRMALGAESSQVLRRVLRQVLALVTAGLVVGALLALWATRSLEALLFGVEPLDPPTMVAGALLLLLIALVAGAVPARRAARVDPVGALREE